MSLLDFNPNYRPKHVAPEFGNDGATDFPMDEIIRHLDGESETSGDEHEVSSEGLSGALREVFVWLTKPNAQQDQQAVKSIGIRAIAAAWVITPESFGNVSSQMAARRFGLNCQRVPKRVAEFSHLFGIRNHCQEHRCRLGKSDFNMEPTPPVPASTTTNQKDEDGT